MEKITKSEQLRKLYTECNLVTEDVYKHKHYVIITRTGIEKIQFAKDIKVTFNLEYYGGDECVVKAIATSGDEQVETYGSAKYGNKVQNEQGKWVDTGSTSTWYLAEMAEKRALSRAVLKITKAYSLGVFGEDEAEDFQKKA
jgi:hypothetical protein